MHEGKHGHDAKRRKRDYDDGFLSLVSYIGPLSS